jgi:hypothetical protein
MSALRHRLRLAAVPLLAPIAFGVLTACNGNDRKVDEQLRADLLAASQAPGNRQQFMSPAELGYPQGYPPGMQQGYAPYPGQYPQPYPQPYPPQAYGYPQPYPQQQAPTRVVYVPQQTGTVRRAGTVGGSGNGSGGSGAVYSERRQTQKGAIIGAASGAAIGVISSRDKAKGAAIGALGGAVLGGLIGHQVKNPN